MNLFIPLVTGSLYCGRSSQNVGTPGLCAFNCCGIHADTVNSGPFFKKSFAGGRVCPNHREIGRQRTVAMLWLQSASHRKRLHTGSEKIENRTNPLGDHPSCTKTTTTTTTTTTFFQILCADMCADDQHCTIGAEHFAAKIFQDYLRLFI